MATRISSSTSRTRLPVASRSGSTGRSSATARLALPCARHRLDLVAARHPQAAMQPFGPPVESGLALELALDAGADHPDAEAGRCRRLGGRPAALAPTQDETVRLQLPGHPDASGHDRQRAIFGGVGGEFMQRERKRLGGARLERYVGPVGGDLSVIAGAIRRKLFLDQAREVGALPAALGEQRVRARERPDAPVDRGDIGLDGVRRASAARSIAPAPRRFARGDRPRAPAAPGAPRLPCGR